MSLSVLCGRYDAMAAHLHNTDKIVVILISMTEGRFETFIVITCYPKELGDEQSFSLRDQ